MAIDYSRFGGANPGTGILQGLQTGFAIRNQQAQQQAAQAQAQQQAAMQAELRTLAENPNAKAEDYARVGTLYPSLADNLKKSFQFKTEDQKNNRIKDGIQLFSALDANKPELVKKLLEEKKAAAENAGTPEGSMEAKGMDVMLQLADNPKSLKMAVGLFLSTTLGADKFADTLGKLGKEQRTAEEHPKQLKLLDARIKESEGIAGGIDVHQSKILPDSTTVIVSNDGKSFVRGPDGALLEGQDRVAAVRKAEQFGASVRQLRESAAASGRLIATGELGAKAKGAEEAGKTAIKMGKEAFDRLAKVQKNIKNTDSAIAALNKGAITGWWVKNLPSIRSSTVELENVRNRLGLDIVSSVTFGQLSEKELALALTTALPTNLTNKQLRGWLMDRKKAQIKMRNLAKKQATFLSKPGNTLDKWMGTGEEQPAEKKPAAAPTQSPAEIRSQADAILGR